MIPQDWHKEPWIKKCTRVAFIEWCAKFQNLSAEDAGLIYDSHVLPKEKGIENIIDAEAVKGSIDDMIENISNPKDPGGVYIDTSKDEG